MRYLFVSCLFVFASCVYSKLPIHIYLESLCPDSIHFIQTQLKPVYEEFKDDIQISFVPFGKAESQVSTYFECQHGPEECQGNVLQACALYLMSGSRDTQVNFMTCQMDVNVDRSGRNCTNKVKFPYELIAYCAQNKMGVLLLLAAEQMTRTVHGGTPLQWVPTVVYNFKYDGELNEKSQRNFSAVVKSLLSSGRMARGDFLLTWIGSSLILRLRN